MRIPFISDPIDMIKGNILVGSRFDKEPCKKDVQMGIAGLIIGICVYTWVIAFIWLIINIIISAIR